MWRALLKALAVLGMVLAAAVAQAADLGTMKIGVLKFGTVNWELDVIKANQLDRKEGFTLDVLAFGGNDAADVALMGGAVDAIVEDWLFVSRQRSDGRRSCGAGRAGFWLSWPWHCWLSRQRGPPISAP